VSTDFEVEILPGGANANVLLKLSASDPALNLEGQQFLRASSLSLSASDIKDLRSGNPATPLVLKIASQVSSWMMSDIPDSVKNTVDGTAPVRFVFRIDETLLDSYADLPFELLILQKNWLVMRPAVSAIVHQPLKPPSTKPANQSLPLKVLVVRPSPTGLGVKVPPAGPICNEIINLLSPNVIQLDLLSREVSSLEPGKNWDEFEAAQLPDLVPKAGESIEERERKENLRWREFRQYLLDRKITELWPATWEFCVKHLKKTDYHIFVYLGHGNHLDLDNSTRKIAVLQFEKPGGKNVDPVRASQLNEALQSRKTPVPVVLLSGCLTAADVAALSQPQKDALSENTLQWSIGSQGVAQGLVVSPTGVQCAVGMRYQIETRAGFDFLKAFFTSLLRETPGDVEAAVRAGRSTLFVSGEFPPSWSAPVIFRARGEEPLLRFIGEIPKTYELDREDGKAQDTREKTWRALIDEPTSQFVLDVLKETEEEIKNKARRQGAAVVMPERKNATPGETLSVLINLHGNLSVDLMKCKLAVSGEGASIQSIRSTQPLKDRKFKLENISESGGSEISFEVKRDAEANALPEGPILDARITVGPAVPAKYTVNLDVLETQPGRIVRPVNNVVLVLPA
jgi:hypothetical protein